VLHTTTREYDAEDAPGNARHRIPASRFATRRAATFGFAWILFGGGLAAAKSGSTLVTAEQVANARSNVERYEWAARTREAAMAAADPWLELSDEQLWELVPEQSLPRSAVIRTHDSCPKCGAKADRHGPYAWKTDLLGKPWKVLCPECGEDFPKNDFGAYYLSGKGPGALWEPSRSDKSLLVNTGPTGQAKGERYGVDDGFGYVDENGERYGFIAYYCHWGLWRSLQSALSSLSEAYVLTGEERYAHKAAVLACRIADVYPDFDHLPMRKWGFDNSSGESGLGKIYGCLWEPGVSSVFVLTVDRLWDWLGSAEALSAFLRGQAIKHELPDRYESPAAIRQHLIRGVLEATVEGLLDGRIRGLEGTHQAAMARVAIALDDPERTPKLLDWIFQSGVVWPDREKDLLPGGRLSALLVDQVDRDGVGGVAAPEYALGWLSHLQQCAGLIASYKRYDRHDLYRDFPAFRRMFVAPLRLAVLGRWTPSLGDSGQTGKCERVGWDLDLFLEAFKRFGDPRLAKAAWEMNGRTVDGLHTSLFDPEPEAIQEQVLNALGDGDGAFQSYNLDGYGLACLQAGAEGTGRALWLYYGRSSGHGHRDRLNLGLFAHGLDLLPDLGYPEFVGPWPQRVGWTSHTVSHNTVMVDRQPQQRNWTGHPTLFKALPGVSVVEVESEEVYPQCTMYRRQSALIDIDAANSYAVDFFRVQGGQSHVLSFHAGEGEPTVTGLKLTKQAKGTLAGEAVEYGDWGGVQPDWSYAGPGFQYLYDVRRSPAAPSFAVDWPLVDTWHLRDQEGQVHLRLTLLGQTGDVVLAGGDPPQNKLGNPRRLRYVLVERQGEALKSNFVSVIEPYVDNRVVRAVELLSVEGEAAAVKIELPDDRVDYVYSSTDAQRVVSLTDDISVAGRFAHVRLKAGTVESMVLVAGSLLRVGPLTIACSAPEWTGTIDDFDRAGGAANCLYTATQLPAGGALRGQEIHLRNDRVRNASYAIKEIRRKGGQTVIDLGDTTFVRGSKDDNDLKAGVVYDFEPGCTFALPNHVRVVRSADGIYRAEFTAPVDLELPSQP
jgi:hypothetical protein